VVRLPAEPTAKRYPAAFWRRQVPLLAAALLSLAWLGAAYYLNWSDPVIIMMPLLLPWLVAAVFLLANPNRHARIDAASGLDHSLRPVEAAEARIMALIAKLDKRMETIAAVAEVASSRFENMAQAFERQMNDMFNAATAVEKIAAKVDVRLRDGAKGLADVKEAFIQDGGALADRLTALVDTLQKAADDAKTSIGATTQSLHGDMERLQAALAATTADGNRLAETLENLDRSVSAIAAA
jgi:chromosome segregation ATPase